MSNNATWNGAKQAQSVDITTSTGVQQQYTQQVVPVQGAPVGPPYQQYGPAYPAPVYPPHGQHFVPVQGAPLSPYHQHFGAVQAGPVGPPYGQQFGAVPAAPVGAYVNPHPAPVVTSEVKVELKAPASRVVVVEPPERDCYFYCFDCSGDYQWYDLRGKGLCWIFLLLLLWLTAGAVIAAVILLWFVIACFGGTSND